MNRNVCALILAGGKSRRMGTDKAGLKLEGRTFLQRIAAELEKLDGVTEKYVSLGSAAEGSGSGTPHTIPVGWETVRDRYPDCGPLGGIHAALSCCSADWTAVVSCDMPLYRKELTEQLLDALENGDAARKEEIVVPVTADGRWHMTCALYRRTLLPVIEERLRAGEYRLRGIGSPETNMILVPAEGSSPEFLRNINTAEEYQALIK